MHVQKTQSSLNLIQTTPSPGSGLEQLRYTTKNQCWVRLLSDQLFTIKKVAVESGQLHCRFRKATAPVVRNRLYWIGQAFPERA